MKYISLIVLLLLSTTTFSQLVELTGKVLDEDGEPIIGASVIFRKDVTIGAISDFNGNYKLKLPEGKNKIICKYTSMVTDTIIIEMVIDQTYQHDFTLRPIVQVIEGVEVKVGKFDKPLEDLTVSMEVIKPGIIENKVTRSIETALDQTPGLNILDGEPQIRGGSGFTFGVGSKVAVIVDDMPMLSGDAGRPEWEFIPVENISQIEVIKGAASVLSGASALSGSIHIRTAYPKLKPKTKVNVYAGMYSSPSIDGAKWWSGVPLITGANVLHSRQIKNLDLVIGANVNYDNGFYGPPRPSEFVKDSITNFSPAQMASKRARINFNIRYRSKKIRGLSYGVNGNGMFSESNLIYAWNDDSTGLYSAYPGGVALRTQKIFHIDPYITMITQAQGKHSFRTRLLYSDNEMSLNQSNSAVTYYGDYMFQKKYENLKDLEFIGGVSGLMTNSQANMYVGSGSDRNNMINISAYTQLEKKIMNALNLSIGGRLEYYQLNDSVTALKPIFRAGASIKLYQETYLRASYGQGYRFPTITERFIQTNVGNFGVFANPDIKPETSWNGEVGIKQGLKFGSLYGYLDIAGFWQEYQNTIEYLFGFWGDPNVSPTTFGFMFVNTGKSRVLGIDVSFSGKAKLGKKAEMTFMTGYNYIVPQTLSPDYVYATDFLQRDYSYNSTSLDSSGGILKYRFLHNVKADVEFTFFEKLSIGFSAKYFSKIMNMDGVIEEFENATSGPYVQDIRYMDYFASHHHGNWIFDARLSYKINEMHKIAIVSANIMNRAYSLRPLKMEAPRSILLQYSMNIDKNKK